MELFTQNLDLWLRIAANTLLLVLYVAHVVYHEKLYLRFRK
jgi:hypothetical protein